VDDTGSAALVWGGGILGGELGGNNHIVPSRTQRAADDFF